MLKYVLLRLIIIPLLPVLYLQGKRIRKEVPSLPEAKEPEGKVIINEKSVLNLLVVGESTVAGVGVETHQEGFAGTLAKELSQSLQKTIDWKVYARSGYTAKRVTYKILPKIKESKFDMIVVGIGGNDAFTLNSLKNWNKHVHTLIQSLRKQFGKTPIYFTNMPPIKEFPAFTKTIKFVVGNLVEFLGKELIEVVSSHDEVFYDNEIITTQAWVKRFNIKASKENFFSDGVHPSKLTYQVWAKNMAQFIQESYSISDPSRGRS